MKEDSSTPHDLLNNIQKLAEERARIRDKISAAVSSPDDSVEETLLFSNPFSNPENKLENNLDKKPETDPENDLKNSPAEVKQANNSAEATISKSNSPEPAEVVPPISPLKPFPAATAGKSQYIMIGSGVLICLLLFGGLFWLFQQTRRDPGTTSPPATTVRTPVAQKSMPTPTATPSPTPTPSPSPSPTPTAKPLPPVNLSFEDGSTGGWRSTSQDGTIDSIDNTTTSGAKSGNHVLEVTYDSDNDHSYPCIGTGNLPGTLKAGRTFTASILKREGGRVKASLYVVDQAGKWHTSGVYIVAESTDVWYPMTFTLPSNFSGSASQVGIILFGDNAVVYIDDVGWH